MVWIKLKSVKLMLRIFYFQRSRCDIRINYRPFTDPVRVLRTAYLIEFISANKKPFRIAFGFVFCGYENFIVHNCEMKKSFNFDSFIFIRTARKINRFSFVFSRNTGRLSKWSVIQGHPLSVIETPTFENHKSHLHHLSTIKYQKSESVILTIWFVALLSDTQISTVWTSSHWLK